MAVYTTIDDAGIYFNTVLYTGNVSTQSITGVGFQPDWLWIKRRSSSQAPCIEDAIRGAGYSVRSSGTDAEQYRSDDITSFDSDGFSLGANAECNGDGTTNVAWNWKANGAGSANTDGSISSTVSANTTTGFSIVKWTGDDSTVTIGHGLGAVPKMIITKRYDAIDNWYTYHHSLGNTKYMLLEANDAEATSNGAWDDTSPTSSVFTKDSATNIDTGTYIAYCFAEKQGYSKFGSYTGNGNADGSFVYTGFRPAFVMLKYTSPGGGVGSWQMYDNKRKGYNTENDYLQANTTSSENSDTDQIDLLSNGFKCKATGSDSNEDGSTYIYMAFAESPFVNSEGVPTNAR